MTDRARLERALIAADKAGDTAAAKQLAAALRSAPAQEPAAPKLNSVSDELNSATQPAQSDTRPVGDAGDVIMDPLRQMGSAAIAAPIAGIAGLGTMAGNAMGLTDKQPGDVVRSVQSALTYQPRTKAGQVASNAVAYPFEKLAQGADYVGGRAAELTGSPAAGAAVNTALQAAPALLMRRGGRAAPQELSLAPESPRAAPIEQPAPQVQATPPPRVEAPPRPQPTQDYVAPDLVLEQRAAPAKKVDTAAEVRARDYARTIGLDWSALSREVQATLANVARDSKQLAKLDPEAVRRQAQLESLPVPVPATRGQVTRDPVQLRNEGNVSATDAGKPIRDTHLDQNQALLDNLDVLKSRVGNRRNAAQTREAVGISVQDQALRAKLALKKEEVSAKYKAAETAGELQGKVSPARLIQTIRNTPDKTHFGWVESWLRDMEVVKKTDSGTVTSKLTLKQMEDLRQAAVARAMDGGTEGYYAGKVISAIDAATDGAGGALYKEARAARRQQALEFEETGAIARLVENKSRTDRAVALEDTWRKTVIGGSIQDLRNVKRSLLTGGNNATRNAGKQAWRDLKAQTIQHIKDEATKSVALNERGVANITPAAMKRAIDSVGEAKLNELFGTGTSQRLNGILEATRTVKTVPPPGHAGSSTMSNMLSFLERGLGNIPGIGGVAGGTFKTVAKLNEMGQAGKVVRKSQDLPLRSRNALADPPPQGF